MDRSYKSTWFSLLFNLLFSGYHILFGVIEHSWWLFTLGIYYVILGAIRCAVVLTARSDRTIAVFTGIMLMVLSMPLSGITVLAVVEDRGTVFHEIVMITIAVYAFSKITLAVIKLVKSRQYCSAKESALRNISLARRICFDFLPAAFHACVIRRHDSRGDSYHERSNRHRRMHSRLLDGTASGTEAITDTYKKGIPF